MQENADGNLRHRGVFFKEIDQSIKRNCRNVNEVRNYLFLFQGFSQELMMLMGNLMKWKFRLPGFLKEALRNLTAKTVNDVLTKNNWKDESVRKACMSVRRYQQQLGYSPEWMTTYVYNIVVLAKKNPNLTIKTNRGNIKKQIMLWHTSGKSLHRK